MTYDDLAAIASNLDNKFHNIENLVESIECVKYHITNRRVTDRYKITSEELGIKKFIVNLDRLSTFIQQVIQDIKNYMIAYDEFTYTEDYKNFNSTANTQIEIFNTYYRTLETIEERKDLTNAHKIITSILGLCMAMEHYESTQPELMNIYYEHLITLPERITELVDNLKPITTDIKQNYKQFLSTKVRQDLAA